MTPTNSERLLRILVSRHRKLANITYKELLDTISIKQSIVEQKIFYRGLINDLVVLLKELREQEIHSRGIAYDDVLEEINEMPGKNFREKVMIYAKTAST